MSFDETLDQTTEILQRRGRYRTGLSNGNLKLTTTFWKILRRN